MPHHVTGAFSSHRKFLDDKEYGEALDCLVKACSDLLLQSPDGQRIFIGKRLVHPQPDWWFVGGRIFPGETPVQSCCRLLRRELALEIEPARFQTVYCQSLNLALTLALTLALSLALALTLTLTLALARSVASRSRGACGSSLRWSMAPPTRRHAVSCEHGMCTVYAWRVHGMCMACA